MEIPIKNGVHSVCFFPLQAIVWFLYDLLKQINRKCVIWKYEEITKTHLFSQKNRFQVSNLY